MKGTLGEVRDYLDSETMDKFSKKTYEEERDKILKSFNYNQN